MASIRTMAARAVATVVVTLRDRLKRAVGEGELPADLDCLSVATFYATVQQGMSIQARDGASRKELLSSGVRHGGLGRIDIGDGRHAPSAAERGRRRER